MRTNVLLIGSWFPIELLEALIGDREAGLAVIVELTLPRALEELMSRLDQALDGRQVLDLDS